MTTRRQFLGTIPAAGAALTVGSNFLLEGSSARAETVAPLAGHFHPKGKAPSKFTLDILEEGQRPPYRSAIRETWTSRRRGSSPR